MGAGYRLILKDHVNDFIRNPHPELKARIRAAFESIRTDPWAGKALRDDLAGYFSYRVARFRVIYRLTGQTIEINGLGPRESIHEEAARRIRPDGGVHERRVAYTFTRLQL